MKSYKEEFLEEFRKIETHLRTERGQDYTFREYEESDGDPDNLRFCRSIRNYLTHNPDSDKVIPVPKELYLFLQGKRKILEKESKTARDTASRVKPLSMQDTFTYAAKRLQKNAIMPVVGEDGKLVAIMTKEILLDKIASGTTPGTPLGKAGIPKAMSGMCVAPGVRYSEIKDEIRGKGTLIVADPESGKYIGMISSTTRH